ncbi:RRP15-like protein [Orussus abietinus]|uniref:RRP15-like protein n=1 Tax=Orussus abietinus TaxID=222816 RepID=UPI000625FE53|nr:RRP15-like protein [Orussus abietinus]
MVTLKESTKRVKSSKKKNVKKFKQKDSLRSSEKTEDVDVSYDNDSERVNESDQESSGISEIGEENHMDSEDTLDTTENADNVIGNPSWADAMQKILRTKKPKRKKTIVLSKAKKLCDVIQKKKEDSVPFEIAGQDGEIKNEKLDSKASTEVGKPVKDTKKHKKDVNVNIRVKPSISDREREKRLQKIATKGVVQLFNVVRQQQIEIDKRLFTAGPSERKREKVLKSIDKCAFLDVLMGESKSIPVDNPVKKDNHTKPRQSNEDGKLWSVLRDDFTMGAKLKDWDKKAPEDEDSSAPEDVDSEDD